MELIFFVAILVVSYGVFSRLSEKSIITAPMYFMLIGVAIGPLGLNLVNFEIRSESVKILAELALISILFTDASTINIKSFFKDNAIATRMLLIGLPLTMVLGTLAAYFVFPEFALGTCILLSLVLSPTDAALGLAVVKSVRVPENIRRAINVESGLNDGLVLSPLLILLAILSESGDLDLDKWHLYLLIPLIFGPVIGSIVGWIGGRMIEFAVNREWMNQVFLRLSSFFLSIVAYGIAELIGGNGFLAAFFAGLFLGINSKKMKLTIQEFSESEGQLLSLILFLVFGIEFVELFSNYWDLRAWIYALLSLTVLRMLPVIFSLINSKLDFKSKLFLGWFGPRGIASILYLFIIVDEAQGEYSFYPVSIAILTIMLSVLLHGMSAAPLSKLFKNSSA